MVGLISASCSQFHGGDGSCFPGTGSIYIRSFFGFSTAIPSHGKELVFCRDSCLGKLWFSCQLPLFLVYFVSILVLSFIYFFIFFTVVMLPPSCCLPFVFFASSFGTFIFDPLDRKEKGMIN